MTEEHLVIPNTMIRLFHTAIGLITGLLIILVVMFFPGGFAQIASQGKAWCKKKFGKAGKEVA